VTNLLSSVRTLYDGFEWAIIFYVSGINAVYFLLMVLGFFALRSYRARQTPETRDALLNSPLLPEVSIIMPAHNEAVTISQSVRSMLNLNYPKFEVVVVNDGSKDDTLGVLIKEFHLCKSTFRAGTAITRPVRAVYRSRDPIRLTVVDKENGGKADALNAGLNVVRAPLIAAALSIAVLSFLGFDGISTLAEESTGRKNPAGRAMIIALFVVAFLFVTQTWLASLLAGGREAFGDDEVGNAFFTLVQAASTTGWMNAFFAVNVMAVGFANAMAAQAATSRLLYSMSRDGQLPGFLSKISSRKVPMAAILVVSALSLVLVLFFVGQIALISSLVNFGALFGFCLLHVSVVWYYVVRKKSKNYLLHLVVPTLGFLIIGYVLFNADALAKIGGLVWLAVGAVVFAINVFRGRGVPELAEEPAND